MTDDLLQYATEFEIPWRGRRVTISRRDNHSKLLEHGAWCVGIWQNSRSSDITTVDYLGSDGQWRYKSGVGFDTAELAFAALATANDPR